MTKFPTYRQPDSKDCGPTCLKIITKHYGRTLSLPELRKLNATAEKIGFKTLGVNLSAHTLKKAGLPAVADPAVTMAYALETRVFLIRSPFPEG